MEKKKTQTSKNLIASGGLIAIFAIVIRLLVVLRQIPITNIIGNTGNAYYSVAFEFYFLILLLTSYSVPTIFAKLFSARMNRGQYKNANALFQKCMLLLACLSLVLSILIFFAADFLAAKFMLEPLSALCLKCLAPSIFIMSISAVFRGFFQGIGTMMPTSVSGVLETLVSFIAGVILARMFYNYGQKAAIVLNEDKYAAAYGAAGAAIGILIGGILSLLFLYILYLSYHEKFKKQMLKDTGKVTESFAQIARLFGFSLLPYMAGTILFWANTLINQKIFNQIMLTKADTANSNATSELFGAFYGKYRVMIFIPIVVFLVMGGIAANRINKYYQKESLPWIRKEVQNSGKQFLIPGVICSLLLTIAAKPIMQIFFKDNSPESIKMLTIGSFAILGYAAAIFSISILQGINKVWVIVINTGIALLIQSVLLAILLKVTGLSIHAVVISNIVFPLLIFLQNMLVYLKELSGGQEI